MKTQSIALGIVAILIIAGGLVAVDAGDETGNGAPSGNHYNLNILGKTWNKGDVALSEDPYYNPVILDNNGHRIFVKLDGKTKILLQEGQNFDVIDADGTDGKAVFQLPKPYAESDVDFEYPAYQVWVRVLSPRGHAHMYTTVYDTVDGTEWIISEEIIQLTGSTGKKSFTDVTRELTTIYADITDDGIDNPIRIGLFDDDYEGFLWAWDYDNFGLRHVQLRFYPMEYV